MTRLAARWAVNAALGAVLVAMGLQLASLSPRAEMLAPFESPTKEFGPPGAWDAEGAAEAPERAPIVRMREAAVLRAVLSGAAEARAGRWSIAHLAAGEPTDPLLADLLLWRAVRNQAAMDPADLRAFLTRRAAWPGLAAARRRAESTLPADATAAELAAFFETAPPATLRGARLWSAVLTSDGRGADAKAVLTDAWRSAPGDAAEEKRLLAAHRTLLTPHHAARFEALIWRNRLSAAHRLAKEMPMGWRAMSEAMLALHRSGRGVDGKLKRTPAALRDTLALTFARIKWRDRKRRRADAEALLRAVADSGRLTVASVSDAARRSFAAYALKYARDAYEDGRYADAAALASNHGLSEGAAFADLEWFSGWMRLRRLQAPEAALAHFETLWNGVKTPISKARAAYWAGEAAAAAQDAAGAADWRRRAAAFPNAFYGQLAAERLSESGVDPDAPAIGAMVSDARRDAAVDVGVSAEAPSLAEAASVLYAAGFSSEARQFLRRLSADAKDAPGHLWIADAARRGGDTLGRIAFANRAFQAGVADWDGMFPIPPSPRFAGRRVEPALLLAVARQESRFMTRARSGAGAIGLMQIMPATAKATARGVALPFDATRLVGDPAYNLLLADAHLAGLLQRYDGSYALSAAAYNAGEGNVAKWLKRFGDPRDPTIDMVDWIETIPFAETRNYVQRVLESAQIYRMRLRQGVRLALASDLNRGVTLAAATP